MPDEFEVMNPQKQGSGDQKVANEPDKSRTDR